MTLMNAISIMKLNSTILARFNNNKISHPRTTVLSRINQFNISHNPLHLLKISKSVLARTNSNAVRDRSKKLTQRIL